MTVKGPLPTQSLQPYAKSFFFKNLEKKVVFFPVKALQAYVPSSTCKGSNTCGNDLGDRIRQLLDNFIHAPGEVRTHTRTYTHTFADSLFFSAGDTRFWAERSAAAPSGKPSRQNPPEPSSLVLRQQNLEVRPESGVQYPCQLHRVDRTL